jgi:hypothetical protein
MGAGGGDELTLLEVGEGALHGAARESRGPGNGLVREADRPARLIASAPEEVQVHDERRGTPVVTNEVGQEGVEDVRVEGDLCHSLL